MTASSDDTLHVYSGRKLLGSVQARGRSWRAYDADGTELGRFDARKAAIAAIQDPEQSSPVRVPETASTSLPATT